MKASYFDWIGWVGLVFIVGAYLLLTVSFIHSTALLYHAMNLVGSSCMALNAKHSGSKPLFWLNVIWASVALIGIGSNS